MVFPTQSLFLLLACSQKRSEYKYCCAQRVNRRRSCLNDFIFPHLNPWTIQFPNSTLELWLEFLVLVILYDLTVTGFLLSSWTEFMPSVLNPFVQHLFILTIKYIHLPKDNMIIGVIEMIVMMTIEAVIKRHMVDIDRNDINLFPLEWRLETFLKFGIISKIINFWSNHNH